jgi:hypothetical protein
VHCGLTSSAPVVGPGRWRSPLWSRVLQSTVVRPAVSQWSDQSGRDPLYGVECSSAVWSDHQCSTGRTRVVDIPCMEQSAPVPCAPTSSVPVVGPGWWRSPLWIRVLQCTVVRPSVSQWSDQDGGDPLYGAECSSALWSDQQCPSCRTRVVEIPSMVQSAPEHCGPTSCVPVVGPEWWRSLLWSRVLQCTVV